MASLSRGVLAPFAILFAALVSLSISSSVEARGKGIPKSAPAFTKFVARFIQDAMPSANVNVTGRLRLDVEAPKGGHTTDLHNVYSVCQRNPDTCNEEVTFFVGQMVELYKAGDVVLSRDALRVIVRPSAYLAAVRHNPKRNKPLAAPLAGDFWMMVVIDQSTTVAVLDETDLGALKLTRKDVLALAFTNTRQAVRQPLQAELAKESVRGMLAGDLYTASTLLFPSLWAPAAHTFKDNLLVSVPASDVVLYADGNKPGALRSIVHAADDVMAHDEKPFSDNVFRWSPDGWVSVSTPDHTAK